MGNAPPEFTAQEVLDTLIPTVATDPAKLEWAAIGGVFRNTLRLRMNMTHQNISEAMLTAYRTSRYPDDDIPEIRGLVRALEAACARAAVPLRIEPGPRDLQTGIVSFFEPVKIRLPFARANLALTIAPGEFQWILTNARKESGTAGQQLEALKSALQEETRTWLRNGNR